MSQYPEKMYRTNVPSVLRIWREQGGRYHLEGTRCKNCGAISFPRRSVCDCCNSIEVEPHKLSQTGTIAELALADHPALEVPGFTEVMPRYIAMVKTDDGPVIMAEIVEALEPANIKVGARVRMVVKKLRREGNGNMMYGYKYVLIDE